MLFNELQEYKRSDLVLFVLDCAENVRMKPITRKQFQKIVYMVEATSPLKKIIDEFVYSKGKYGPYSKDIQNILNMLIAFDLADIKESRVNGKNIIKSSYSISENGKIVVEKLQTHAEYKEKRSWVLKIMKIVKLYGIENIVKIVYAEPTFESVKKKGLPVPITEIRNNLSMKLVEFLKDISKKNFDYYMENSDLILIDFFNYLYTKARKENV